MAGMAAGRRRRAEPDSWTPTYPSLLSARTAVPLSPAGTLARRNVLRRLDSAPHHRLTVVSAGPGWGKTTAVADWVSRQDVPVAWLTVDRLDDSPAVFWQELLQAVVRSGGVPDGHPLRDIDPGGTVSSGLLRSLFHALESLPGPVVVVLDDFHVVVNTDVLEAVEALVRHDLPLHLVLLTRMDPALHLHRLRVSGQLVEVSADDLAFGPDEVRRLATAEGVDLSDEDVRLVLDRTEGWPAGVRLALMYLERHGPGHDLSGFAGDDRSVAEYLLAEVLEGRPEDVRDFMLRTSVVSPVNADLADAVVDGEKSAVVLDELVRGHHFVAALDSHGGWFRYHPLLRQLLTAQLRRTDREAFRESHRRAAVWLAHHGEPVRALQHAAGAGDWGLFATLFVETAGGTIVGKDRETVAALLASIPYADLEPSAPVELCAAATAIVGGRFLAARRHAERARFLLETGGGPDASAARALAEIVAAASARSVGDIADTVAGGRAAMRRLDDVPWPFPAMRHYRSLAENQLAVGLLWSGDVTGARRALADVVAASAETGIDLGVLNAHAHLAMCDVVESRFDRAESLAVETLDLALPRGWAMHLQLRLAHLVLALVRVLRGDHDGADVALAAGQAAVVGGTEPPADVLSRVVQVLVGVSRRRLRAADHARGAMRDTLQGWEPAPYLAGLVLRAETEVQLLAVRDGALPTVPPDPAYVLSPIERVCLGRLHLAAGDAVGAAERIASVNAAGIPDVDLLTQVEAWLVRALSAHQLRKDRDALDALGHAVDLARPQHLVRPFLVVAGDRLVSLLRLREGVALSSDAFVRELTERVAGSEGGREAEPEPEPLLVPLTDRELAMLAALPTMNSNAEIAAEFFVSVNTVKAHLKALYRKLGVASRREAVRRGRELGLLL